MSRCFPYPPPYFGEAEIESIKREKERLEEEANKARKREKKDKKKEKKEKKHKRSDQEHELSKELIESLKKRKYEELGLVEPEDEHGSHQHHKSKKSKKEQLETSGMSDASFKKPRDEQLERSDLSEEHGQPTAGGPANFESPEWSQDSSKRRLSGSMPSRSPSLTNSGSTIRIKLQSKSRDSAPDPRTSKTMETMPAPKSAPQATKSRELFSVPQGTKSREQVSVPQSSKPRISQASLLQKPRAAPVTQILKPREPVLQASNTKEPALQSLVPKPRELPLPSTPKALPKPREVPLPNAPKALPSPNVTGLPKRDGALKLQAGPTTCSAVARGSVAKEHLMKAKIEPCNRTQIWEEKREVFQKPLPGTKPTPRNTMVLPAVKQDSILQPIKPVNPKLREARAEPVSAVNAKHRAAGDGPLHLLKQDRRPVVKGVPPVATDDPCFSGRKTETEENKESKHCHHSSSSRRSKRKEASKLYEELFASWAPPVIDQFQEHAAGLDWLLSGAKRRRVENEKGEDDGLSSSKCKAGEGLLGHTNGTAGSHYQTWATHIPELDMYQLPYVVPF